jgi:hypothetical protein
MKQAIIEVRDCLLGLSYINWYLGNSVLFLFISLSILGIEPRRPYNVYRLQSIYKPTYILCPDMMATVRNLFKKGGSNIFDPRKLNRRRWP